MAFFISTYQKQCLMRLRQSIWHSKLLKINIKKILHLLTRSNCKQRSTVPNMSSEEMDQIMIAHLRKPNTSKWICTTKLWELSTEYPLLAQNFPQAPNHHNLSNLWNLKQFAQTRLNKHRHGRTEQFLQAQARLLIQVTPVDSIYLKS